MMSIFIRKKNQLIREHASIGYCHLFCFSLLKPFVVQHALKYMTKTEYKKVRDEEKKKRKQEHKERRKVQWHAHQLTFELAQE
jgi:hypothetical protein